MKKIILCLSILISLSSCKINMDIFGKGTVKTISGSFDCSSNGSTQSGDCTQTYNVDENNVACNPNDTDCTVVTDTITETFVATPELDDSFDGFTDACVGAGPCIKTITEADADHDQAVILEAHFDEEPIPQAATYNYNYLNQRTSKMVAGVTTYFIYDEQGNLLSEIDQNGNSIKDYVYMEGEYVAHVEKTGDTGNDETQEQVFYSINDHLGQPMMMLRADMEFSHEQYTDPFGKVHAQYVNASLGTGPTKQNRRLPGQYYDAETGYYQNWNRDYDPRTGRYLQSDPIGLGGGINTYGYALQNPINRSDPSGLSSVTYNDQSGKITIYKGTGEVVGTYAASNNAQRGTTGIDAGTYSFSWHSRHIGDDENSQYGSNGNFIFNVTGKEGAGVHSGRKNSCDKASRCGSEYATSGCIRTTDQGTKALLDLHYGGDPLTSLTVVK